MMGKTAGDSRESERSNLHDDDVESGPASSRKMCGEGRFVVSTVLIVLLALSALVGSFFLGAVVQPLGKNVKTVEDAGHPAVSDDVQNVSVEDDDFDILSSSMWIGDAKAPPQPSEDDLANLDGPKPENTSSGRKLGSGSIKTGVPMIIRNKYPSRLNAELSWDTSRCGSWHPMASVEYSDPVSWRFEKRGNYYAIYSMYPGSWENAELSWDTKSPHPMISVEFYDPVNWELKHQGGKNYRIKSKYPGSWHNAELSWDGSWCGSSHPMASLEFHDPVDWEITEAFSHRGFWKYIRSMPSSSSYSESTTVSYGTELTHGWSRTSTWSKTTTASVESGLEIEGVGGMSASLEQSVTQEVATTVTRELRTSYGKERTINYNPDAHSTSLWQFVVETTNHHYKYKGQTVSTYTQSVELTGGRGKPPRCVPGYCKFDTGCQECQPGGRIGPPVAPPPGCSPTVKDTYKPSSSCDYWKRMGYCKARYVQWMNQNCKRTCQCT